MAILLGLVKNHYEQIRNKFIFLFGYLQYVKKNLTNINELLFVISTKGEIYYNIQPDSFYRRPVKFGFPILSTGYFIRFLHK